MLKYCYIKKLMPTSLYRKGKGGHSNFSTAWQVRRAIIIIKRADYYYFPQKKKTKARESCVGVFTLPMKQDSGGKHDTCLIELRRILPTEDCISRVARTNLSTSVDNSVPPPPGFNVQRRDAKFIFGNNHYPIWQRTQISSYILQDSSIL